ncbi:MAG TPA: nucleoside deaminase [Thermoanaerobaculia bacterium]|nr:nucleoside deaminase [Thermoanaerobaculia bacterium]
MTVGDSPTIPEDERWMREALRMATRAASRGEVPVGALVVRGGRALGRGANRREAQADPTHHAEIEAIRKAARRAGTWRLDGAIPTDVRLNHRCALTGGVLAAESAELLRRFFRERRGNQAKPPKPRRRSPDP